MLPPPPRSTLFPYTTLFRSHQQRRALAAEPGPSRKGDAFLFGRQRDRLHILVGAAALDEPGVAGVRHIPDLPHIGALERVIEPVGPIHIIHSGSASFGFSPSSSSSSFTGIA